ncbi:MAG: helix-turn-helix transcriptional regulator [Deltaproteobacteria bacterium]|nr:helix-turn-helix transcriptional regulator [Nannocystaceae bacterium]
MYEAQYRRPSGDGSLEVCTLTHAGALPAPWLAPGYVINLVLDGVADLWTRGATHRVGPGHVVLANPGQLRSVTRRCTPTATTRSLTIDERFFVDALRIRGGAAGAAFDEATTTNGALQAALIRLYGELGEPGRLAVEEAVEDLLDEVGRCVSGTDTRRWPAHLGIRRAQAFLEEHFEDDVGIDTLTSISGLSRAHLIREFRRSVGVPPHQYLIHARVRRARSLLATGSSVAEAALATGFYDQSHFARHFRRLVGITAVAYKRAVGS